MKIKPVILCGGAGTRLWPKSKKNIAKQCRSHAKTMTKSYQASQKSWSSQAKAMVKPGQARQTRPNPRHPGPIPLGVDGPSPKSFFFAPPRLEKMRVGVKFPQIPGRGAPACWVARKS